MEDQTSANTEELEPTSSGTAVASDDADAETIKKNGRTLKLKTHESETSNEAVAESQLPPTLAGKREYLKVALDVVVSDDHVATQTPPVPTP